MSAQSRAVIKDFSESDFNQYYSFLLSWDSMRGCSLEPGFDLVRSQCAIFQMIISVLCLKGTVSFFFRGG